MSTDRMEKWNAGFKARSDEIDAEVRAELMKDIEAFCAKHGMSTAEFGRQAINDRGCYGRLKNGTSPTQRTVAQIDAYIEMGPSPAAPSLSRTGLVPYAGKSTPQSGA